VLFTLLFVYVFGSGVVLPGGGSYTDFAIAVAVEPPYGVESGDVTIRPAVQG